MTKLPTKKTPKKKSTKKKPPKVTVKRFYEDVFGFTWVLIKGGNEHSAYLRFCKMFGFKADKELVKKDDYSAGLCVFHDSHDFLIWFPSQKPRADVVAHEATHAAIWVARRVQLDPKNDGGEVMAHYVEYIVRNINGHSAPS